jgi:hypothetical protein
MTGLIESMRNTTHHLVDRGRRLVLGDTALSAADIETVENLLEPARSDTNYFAIAESIREKVELGAIDANNLNNRRRTFMTDFTAYHLNSTPSIGTIGIDEAAARFRLPDLRRALEEYWYYKLEDIHEERGLVLGVHAWVPPEFDLSNSFTRIKVWFAMRVQTKSVRRVGVNPSHVVCAEPPSDEWPHGRYDQCLFINHHCPPWTGKADLRGITEFLSFHNRI